MRIKYFMPGLNSGEISLTLLSGYRFPADQLSMMFFTLSPVCIRKWSYPLIIILLFLSTGASAQFASISGKITDAETRQALPSANVFLSNSTKSTQTNEDGSFSITGLQPGEYILVVSFVGYEMYKQNLSVGKDNQALSISLTRSVVMLNELVIKPDVNREKYLKMFVKAFIGVSENARDCEILNPRIIDLSFNKDENSLEASTSGFLEIENNALGYKLNILLDGFKVNYNSGTITYLGKTFFKELRGSNAQIRRWKRNRMQTYLASMRYFYRSLTHSSSEENGFQIHSVLKRPNEARLPSGLISTKIKQFSTMPGSAPSDSLAFWVKQQNVPEYLFSLSAEPVNGNQIIKPSSQPQLFEINFNEYLYVIHRRKQSLGFSSDINTSKRVLILHQPNTKVNLNGILNNPLDITVEGSSIEKIADLLPEDFIPDNEPEPKMNLAGVSLTSFIDTTAFEKIYLHTDREQYTGGEDIWYKAYLLNGHTNRLFNFSNNLYVELIDPESKIVEHSLLRLDNGLGNGNFKLRDSIVPGKYRLRAYTNWMRNFGDSFFFEKEIDIYSEQGAGSELSSANRETSDSVPGGTPRQIVDNPASQRISSSIVFFPESGSLIEEVANTVAFKIESGKGIAAKGTVVSSSGNIITRFTSDNTGMGAFSFTPLAGQHYLAEGQFSDGTYFKTALPPALSTGLSMHIQNNADSIFISVSTNRAGLDIYRKTLLFVLLKNRGRTYYSDEIELIKEKQVLVLSKRGFPPGISSVTLYDASGRPHCERLFYHDGDGKLTLNISADKTSYLSKGKTILHIKANDQNNQPVKANLSLSVTDAGIVKENSGSILSYLALQSEIRGKIDQPDKYFDLNNPNRLKEIDLLLMTQGWRDFLWKRLADSAFKINYPLEQGIRISGRVRQISAEKPVAGSNITLSAPALKGDTRLASKTDSAGKYYFEGLEFYGSQTFKLTTRNSKAEKNGYIILDSLTNTSAPVNTSAKDVVLAQEYLAVENALTNRAKSRLNLKDTIKLSEVVVKGSKFVRLWDQMAVEFGYPEESFQIKAQDSVFKSVEHYLTVKLVHNSEIFFSGVDKNGWKLVCIPRLLVNGKEVPIRTETEKDIKAAMDSYNTYFQLSMNQVQKILVKHVLGQPTTFRWAEAPLDSIIAGKDYVYSENPGGSGRQDLYIIYLTLKPGAMDQKEYDVVNERLNGYTTKRIFYSPEYPEYSTKSDLRTTIHWEPNITTNAQGEATVTYYNADPKTKVRVTIEGITEKGIPITGRAYYEVK